MFILGLQYSNFRNYRENFIFANSVKRHICDAKIRHYGMFFSTPVNDRVIPLFREERFIFTKLRTRVIY